MYNLSKGRTAQKCRPPLSYLAIWIGNTQEGSEKIAPDLTRKAPPRIMHEPKKSVFRKRYNEL